MKTQNIQMSDSLPVVLLLSSVGGFLESYSFLSRDGVFANCQTGNLVLLAMNLAEGNLTRALSYLLPVVSFIVGVFLVEMTRVLSSNRRLHWRQYSLLFEAALLAAVSFIPSGKYDIIATTLIAFSCSIQVDTFRKVKGSPCATTMCTGNLRSGTFQLFRYLSAKDSASLQCAGNYLAVIAIFMAGAVVGALSTRLLGEKSIWISCAFLLLALLLMFVPAKKNPLPDR